MGLELHPLQDSPLHGLHGDTVSGSREENYAYFSDHHVRVSCQGPWLKMLQPEDEVLPARPVASHPSHPSSSNPHVTSHNAL